MKTVINQDTIRDHDGTLKPTSFKFHLQDFGQDLITKYPNANLMEEIGLDYDVLAEYLIDTEHVKESTPPRRNIIESEPPFSPEEKLRPDDERKFRELERQSAARLEALDPDYSLDPDDSQGLRTEFNHGSRSTKESAKESSW
jgi:hypothetical protein